MQYKVHIDMVVAYRKRYLESVKKEETNKKFQKVTGEVEVNWETIKAKIKQEKEQEKQQFNR